MDFFSKNKYKIVIICVLLLILLHSIFGSISVKQFFNLKAFEIIISGILITVIISFSFDTLTFTLNMIKDSFVSEIDYESSIYRIYTYAVRIKKQGVLKIQPEILKEDMSFLKEAMMLVCDYVKPDDIEDILTKDINSKERNLFRAYNVLKMMAQVAPAFGLIGTLIGMVGLLSHIDNPGLIAGNMSSALVSTLYGALISNFIAVPLMGRLKEYINKRILLYKIIREGVILIGKNDSTINVFDKMNSMLPDDKRLNNPRSNMEERKKRIYELKK